MKFKISLFFFCTLFTTHIHAAFYVEGAENSDSSINPSSWPHEQKSPTRPPEESNLFKFDEDNPDHPDYRLYNHSHPETSQSVCNFGTHGNTTPRPSAISENLSNASFNNSSISGSNPTPNELEISTQKKTPRATPPECLAIFAASQKRNNRYSRFK